MGLAIAVLRIKEYPPIPSKDNGDDDKEDTSDPKVAGRTEALKKGILCVSAVLLIALVLPQAIGVYGAEMWLSEAGTTGDLPAPHVKRRRRAGPAQRHRW